MDTNGIAFEGTDTSVVMMQAQFSGNVPVSAPEAL